MQRHTVHACDGVAYVPDEALQIYGGRLAVVDDEVRVLLRHRGTADAEALEAGSLDEARGVIAGRVGEHRPAAPLPDRLRGLALCEELLHLAGVIARTALEGELGGEEPLLGLRWDHLPVADAVLGDRAAMRA